MLIVKKWVFICAALLLTRLLTAPAAAAAPGISARSAVLMHSGGELVYEKNGDEELLIASTTKLMTAIVVIENADLTDSVTVSAEHCGVEGSSMYLRPGESRSVYELLTGLLLASGNDAALALSEHVAQDSGAFAELMNRKAQELGMEHSHFANPHGLNAEGHYSTARDLALLMDYCMDNAVFAAITSMRSCEIGGQTLINHNRLLQICPGCIGGKTGYTMLAGRCLVSCCQREGTRFVCVTLSAPDDWNDHCRLYDWAFGSYCNRDISAATCAQVAVVSGDRQSVTVSAGENSVFVPKDAEVRITLRLPRFVFAPVTKGEEAGSYTAAIGDNTLKEGTLYYNDSVNEGL